MQSCSEPAGGGHAVDVRVVDLFVGFLGLGLMSFGGALPFARRALVEERRWLTADAFTDLLGLCQFLPGGNVINLSVAVGMKFRGVPGAIAGLLGLVAGPTLVVIGLGVLYAKTQHNPSVHHLFGGLAAAAAGLLVAMAVKVAKPLRDARMAACVAALAFVAIAVLRTPLLPTMLVLTPVSIWLASRAPREANTSAQGVRR
ncbi:MULTISPECIES: chromate transporter [Burkholderia]|uniref:Chromate transporter n=1 Tax=Burkholderia mayonis TaxID=1385591 RepID=A0A1B4FHH5_9BURK|nr:MULTISPECIES: chromate transporter [Burkholderia]AOJ03153.1 chromate transporter [Burkholderia mayonis]KVE39072.1 chromate transporter [Burkholderia sp. BDU5]KVE48282.1 chromate transporter [Burkholderia mayonis]